jgi:hypothetical protein
MGNPKYLNGESMPEKTEIKRSGKSETHTSESKVQSGSVNLKVRLLFVPVA